MSKIVVIGSLNMDLLVKTGRMPSAGETLQGQEFHTIPGGKGANQALSAARLGGNVAMLGRVGRDRFGEALSQGLAADGVDISHLLVDDTAPTGVALIVIEANGENRIILVGGANLQTSPADVLALEDVLRQASLLIMQFEIPMPVIEAVLQIAQRSGVPVLLNAAPAYALAKEMLAMIAYLVVNEHEAAVLSGIAVTDVESARQAALTLQQQGAGLVIITLGALGALAVGAQAQEYAPAFPIQAVDTTAAGDAFIGGLAVSLLQTGLSLADRLRFANAAGALAALRLGAQSSLPTRAEVEKFLFDRTAF